VTSVQLVEGENGWLHAHTKRSHERVLFTDLTCQR